MKKLLFFLLALLLLTPLAVRGDETPPIPIRLETKDKNQPKMPSSNFILCYIQGNTLSFTPDSEQWDVTVESQSGDLWSFSVDSTSPSVVLPFTSGRQYLITVETSCDTYQGLLQL